MRNAAFAAITSAALFLSSTGILVAEGMPPKPADGIRDEARAFSESAHAQLAAEMRSSGQVLHCDVWLLASTFLTSEENLRSYSREVRRAWSGDNDAILLAYDRASDKQFITFSPNVWDRYPSADLVFLMHSSAMVLAEKERPLSDRLSQMMGETLTRLEALEKQRLNMQQPMHPGDIHLAKMYVAGLAVPILILLVLGSVARRRDAAADDTA